MIRADDCSAVPLSQTKHERIGVCEAVARLPFADNADEIVIKISSNLDSQPGNVFKDFPGIGVFSPHGQIVNLTQINGMHSHFITRIEEKVAHLVAAVLVPQERDNSTGIGDVYQTRPSSRSISLCF